MNVFITGATGYLGRPLCAALTARGHRVLALCRNPRQAPAGVQALQADVFQPDSYAAAIRGFESVVHLVGVPKPAPWKGPQFQAVDLASARACVRAAATAGVHHFVYLSVAQPAPVMKTYIAARQQAEAAIRATGIPATILRPCYVLGPGHWWPYLLIPAYAAAERIAATRESALRLGLVTHAQMVAALVRAVEDGPAGAGIREVPEIRRAAA